MAFLDSKQQGAAALVLVLGVALIIALTPYATGLVGIPVLYAVFAPVHDWLALRTREKVAASAVVLLALFLIVVPGLSFAGLIVNEAQEIAGNVVRSPLLRRLSQPEAARVGPGAPPGRLGGQPPSWGAFFCLRLVC